MFLGDSFYYNVIFSIGSILSSPLLIIGAIFFWTARNRQKTLGMPINVHLRKEDILSQLLYVIGFFFVANLLIAINRELGHPISLWWITLSSIAVFFIASYLLKSVYLLPIALGGGMFWWALKASDWIFFWSQPDMGRIAVYGEYPVRPLSIIIGLALIAIALYIIGYIHKAHFQWGRFSFVYTMVGLLFITLVLFIFSTQAGVTELLGALSSGGLPWTYTPFVLSFIVFGSIIVFSMGYAVQHGLLNNYEVIALSGLTLVFLMLSIVPASMLPTGSYSDYYGYAQTYTDVQMFWILLFNVLVFVEVLGIIFIGYVHRDIGMINLGTLLLFILIAIKYFDWFFSFLDKSLFFISAGVILFVIGYLMEKGRRQVLSTVLSKKAE
ncbi:hypothetical protein HGA91_03885 [candidate division WWE3 bacterium]|nr:hypothetical protein [candidate division WWE3 bacterium]